jgi:hypothetical protein
VETREKTRYERREGEGGGRGRRSCEKEICKVDRIRNSLEVQKGSAGQGRAGQGKRSRRLQEKMQVSEDHDQ